MALSSEPTPAPRRRSALAIAAWAWAAGLAIFILVGVLASFYDRFPGDEAATDRFQALDVPVLGGYLGFINTIGNGWAFVSLIGVCAVALFILRSGWDAPFLLVALVARVANGQVKDLVDRPRPAPDLVEVHEKASSFSFPSGHTVGTTVLFAVLLIALSRAVRSRPLRWLLQAGCVLIIVSAGPARVYEGVHWPSDVLGGYLLAALFLAPAFFAYRALTGGSRT